MGFLRFIVTALFGITHIYSQDIPVYIALRQQNIPMLEDKLRQISDPVSAEYGKYLSAPQIQSIVDPPHHEQRAVLTWLSDNNIQDAENHGDAIRFSASYPKLAHVFKIPEGGISKNKLLDYSIPPELSPIIEFVEMEIKRNPLNKNSRYISRNSPVSNGDTDERFFGREPLMYMYNVSTESVSHSVIGVLAEFQGNGGFLPSDLTMHQASNNQSENDVVKIVGGNVGIDIESVLDVQMMSQAGNGMEMWFWDTPYWLFSFAVDYFNSQNIGNIISMSWGWAEDSQCDIIDCSSGLTSEKYVERVNTEFLKLALRGVTIVVASGDAGAPGRTNEQCGYGRPMNPVFPGSSPYITSVGATYVPYKNATKNATTPLCRDFGCIVGTDERSISFEHVGWTAGGGFDLYLNETPWWQSDVVRSYLESGVVLPSKSLYNSNGRAYPDLTAIGHNCPIYAQDEMQGVDGTSCSAPVTGGLLGLVSNHLWNRYHIKLGFANPLLYYIHSNCEDCFRDVTVGHNWCTEQQCCDNATNFGFTATKGYDPVSGLGSLNVGKIIDFIDEML